MSKIGQHIQEQQEKADADCMTDRPADGYWLLGEYYPPKEDEHAKLIREKWGLGTWPQPKEKK